MKSKGLLIALIISLGVNLGAIGTFAYYSITKNNPKLMWEKFQKKDDEAWKNLQDKLGISSELRDSLHNQFRMGFEETKSDMPKSRPIREALCDLMKQPQLDTVKLRELLEQEKGLQSEIGFKLYANLYKISQMLPSEKRGEFIEAFRFSIMFYGSPWYIFVKPKDDRHNHQLPPRKNK
jgi:uncharacterized membrane protein